VIPSQIHLHETMVRKYGLQTVSDQRLTNFAFYQYRGYMAGFLRDRARIPPENLIEIRYEDFVADRMGWLRTIYDRLDLGDFAAIEAPVREYIRSVERYAPHTFAEDPALRRRIDTELGFAFAALGYEPASAR
jgi:hypothetical protein